MPRFVSALLAAGLTLLTVGAPALASGHRHAKKKHRGAVLALGYYQCYQTTRNVSQINGGVSYNTRFTESFTLSPGLRYQVGLRTSPDYRTQHVASSGSSVRFVGGPYDSTSDSMHLSGTFYPQGVTMPNSRLNPAQLYTLVLHGAPGDTDVSPPADQSGDRSFWYCKRR